jgi:beta-galactosidase beta subunit
MKKITVLVCMSILVFSCKSSWNLYKPTQSDIVGKKVVSYTKKNKQIAFGAVHTDSKTVETSDHPSTATENQEIEKNMIIDLKGFFNKKTKVTNVNVTNATVTNLSSIKNINPGSFVYGAIKAEKVVVTLKNESDTQITPQELTQELEVYLKTLNPAITDVANLVNEISFSSKDESKYEITNPNVYYLFQEAKLLENQGINNKWFQNFARYGDVTLTKNDPISNEIIPVISSAFKDKVDRIIVQLARVEKNDKIELHVRYTTKSGTEMKKIPEFSDGLWNSVNFIIKEYDLSSDSYKVVRINIKAKKVGDDIVVSEGKVSYPEKTLQIVKY